MIRPRTSKTRTRSQGFTCRLLLGPNLSSYLHYALGLGNRRRNFNSLFKCFVMRADEMQWIPGRCAPNRAAPIALRVV